MAEQWDADAPSAGPESSDGLASPVSEQQLCSAVRELIASLDRQSELLMQIVAQNADLISMMAQDPDDEFEFDLSGRRIA